MTNQQASQRLKQLLDSLKNDRKRLDSEMMQPLEMLAKIMPLMQDQARFVRLYQRQRELADRLESVEGQDGQDDPILKARMRDLETEQYLIRQGLIQLLVDIRDHVEILPEDPRFDALRKSVREFAGPIREVAGHRCLIACFARTVRESTVAGCTLTRLPLHSPDAFSMAMMPEISAAACIILPVQVVPRRPSRIVFSAETRPYNKAARSTSARIEWSSLIL
ncbi:MAG: hypothetical protein IH897_06040 [Planctomycetes bacterium]|nr:hypothetical protein [Planctomycetota bacterium]